MSGLTVGDMLDDLAKRREEKATRLIVEAGYKRPAKVEVVRDPAVPGVLAVRADGDTEYLIHADGAVEVVEFASWPPRSV